MNPQLNMVRRLMSDWVHGGLLYFSSNSHKTVILRACDFFAFAQKRLLSLERRNPGRETRGNPGETRGKPGDVHHVYPSECTP
jgi:hypothetical protein